MLYDNSKPRYLPHIAHPEVLLMGLSPRSEAPWIEPDGDIGHFHQHKLAQRRLRGDGVYCADEQSLPAQRELHSALLEHLLEEHPDVYQRDDDALTCTLGSFRVELQCGEPLWGISLAVADDLVIMEKRSDQYHLTAASLCSPSHWWLQQKVGRSMREIHDPIPGFQTELTPKIDRFFDHLRPNHPVVRFNWSVQADGALAQLPDAEPPIARDTPLYYRVERQSLVRLPTTGAIAFTIRVYLHPLEMLADTPGAITALFAAMAAAPPPLAEYKGFPSLAPALEKYRQWS